MTGAPCEIIDATIDDFAAHRASFAVLFELCVAEGPALGYRAPLTSTRRDAILDLLSQSLATGQGRLLLARIDDCLIGSIMILDDRETEPHLGQIAKLMIHPAHRRQGFATRLLAAAESVAAAIGKTRLYLFTGDDGTAAALYASNRYELCGRIPEGGTSAEATRIDALIFTKALIRPDL
ncbi:GNAT family N-acetyltransferase [Acidiphilium acidophilum]|uniref:GNAT family N-acetyltransferase n=1 Tax=Acidiphilium acidophilum TaxID=76588 RepID=UPI002E8E6662|nr:GNAT family N-acetyltransferase [Acidiphilium acidophilum]